MTWHGVAWSGMWICVRSKDAQKQLARTSVSFIPCHFIRSPSRLRAISVISVSDLALADRAIYRARVLRIHILNGCEGSLCCYRASLVRTLFIRHARATSLSSACTKSKTQQNIELMTFALTWCANIFVGCSVTPTFFSTDHFLL